MTALRATAVLLLSAGAAAAQSGLPEPRLSADLSADLSEVTIGIYCADPNSRPTDPDAGLYLSRTPDIVATGRQVPAEVGMAFGIVFQTVPGRAELPFDMSMTHPPLPEFEGSVTHWQSVYDFDGIHTNGWSFETRDTAQPGLWALRGEDEGRLLFKVTFEVVSATQRPDLTALCL